MNREKGEIKVRRRHALAFPLFAKGNAVVGDLKIKLTVVEKKANRQSAINLVSSQRRIVVSEMNEDYFQPVYSRMMRVCIGECPDEMA